MINQPIKLLFRGNSDQADIKSSIPLSVYAWIICDIIRIKPLFLNGLERTAIYTPDDNMNFFFDMLFKVYKPSKPLERFYDYQQALNWLTTTTTLRS